MSLSEQIGIYASVIVVMLTLLRILSGITGSKVTQMSVLLSTVSSTVALIGASIARFLIEIDSAKLFIIDNIDVAKAISLFWFVLWFLSMIYYFGLGVILRLYVRSSRFKDWGIVGNLRITPPARWFRQWRRKKAGDKKGYETNSPENALDEKTIKIFQKHINESVNERRSTLISGSSPWELRKKLLEMFKELLDKTSEEINYVCCTISPYNLWALIEKEFSKELIQKLKRRIVFVDAYTKTFGFGDEILTDRINRMKADKDIEIISCDSASGIHSGTSEAFKILKKNAKYDKRERGACTVIYDTLSVLAIPESETEVAEFIIHLSAAEQTYDMFTVFLEASIDTRESPSIDAIKACCGDPIELKDD